MGVAVVAVAAEGIRGVAVRLDELGVVGSTLEALRTGGELEERVSVKILELRRENTLTPPALQVPTL